MIPGDGGHEEGDEPMRHRASQAEDLASRAPVCRQAVQCFWVSVRTFLPVNSSRMARFSGA